MDIIPISKNLIYPIPTSKIICVDSLEEFEEIEFEINTTLLGFDNYKQSFYVRERDKYGVYSIIKIYLYENIAQKIEALKREEFLEKCKKAGLSSVDTLIAEKIYIDKLNNDNLWDWLLRNKIKDVELDTVKTIKYRIKKKLYPELIKHPKKKI